MTYIRVRWKHSIPTEPVYLYSELDDARWEVRKIEVFLDGRRGYASAAESVGGTRLGTVPVPLLVELAADSQFEPDEITGEEFERVWAHRRD
jgi:hypothetical protein